MTNPFRRLIAEVHRRSLWQVMAVYVVAAWVGYQVILGLVEGLALPGWLPGLAVVLFVIGLPIVLATAMVQEGLPGMSRNDPTLVPGFESDDAPPPPPASVHRRIFTWRNAIAGGIAAFALWGVVAAVLAFRGAGGGNAAPPARQLADDAGLVTVTTSPPGAAVRLTPAVDGALRHDDAFDAGRTPVRRGIDAGEYVALIELAGHQPLELRFTVEPDGETALEPELSPAGQPSAMVRVPAGTAPDGAAVDAFLIDRYEVTNDDFAAFVAAGGYQAPDFWPESLEVSGALTPRARALAAFVDRTGHAGPRGWSGGVPPASKGNHPVAGVSWHEAAAYCRWAERALPTAEQWWRAALGEGGYHFPWGDDGEHVHARANFNLEGTTAVGAFPTGLSPFGAADMAGNVREWLADPPEGRPTWRKVVGGGWQDPGYMFEAAHAEAFPPDFAGEQIGFRCVRSAP